MSDARPSMPEYNPKRLGHATSIHGDHLVIFEGFDGIGQVAFDDDGCGPYHLIAGCPNCGKNKGEWWDGMTFVGSLNSGCDPNEPCSRVCRYQLEWQAELASRKLTQEAPHV